MTAILLTLVYTVCQSNYWAVQFGGTDPLSISIFSKLYKGGYTSYLSPQVCHTTRLRNVFNHYVCVHCRPMTNNCDSLCLRRMWGQKLADSIRSKNFFAKMCLNFSSIWEAYDYEQDSVLSPLLMRTLRDSLSVGTNIQRVLFFMVNMLSKWLECPSEEAKQQLLKPNRERKCLPGERLINDSPSQIFHQLQNNLLLSGL